MEDHPSGGPPTIMESMMIEFILGLIGFGDKVVWGDSADDTIVWGQ